MASPTTPATPETTRPTNIPIPTTPAHGATRTDMASIRATTAIPSPTASASDTTAATTASTAEASAANRISIGYTSSDPHRVPHLRDSSIVAKVGIRAKHEPHFLTHHKPRHPERSEGSRRCSHHPGRSNLSSLTIHSATLFHFVCLLLCLSFPEGICV